MNFVKPLITFSIISMILLGIGTEFSSCEKIVERDTITVRDTIRVVVHDTAHDCKNLNADMVAFYPFINGSLRDSSGNNNHIYFNNAVATADRFGYANSAYLFNGTSSYMRVKNSSSLNPANITLVATIKINGFYQGPCEGNQILGKGSPDYINGFIFMRFSDKASDCDTSTTPQTNNAYFYAGYGDVGTRADAKADTSRIQSGQWYTVVYTYDGFESRLYVNGALKNITVRKATITPNTMDLLIGGHDSAQFPYFFNGIIDEVRIYNKALCYDQVKAFSDLKR